MVKKAQTGRARLLGAPSDKKSGKAIIALTVREILDEQIAKKLA